MSQASPTCLNCGHRVAPWDHFCSQCGQDTKNHAPTLWEFVHEWVLHYLALEGKLWRSLANLMLRPGRLTLEYLAGRKLRYVLPLRLVLTLGIAFFLLLKLVPGDPQVVNLGTPETPAVAASQAASELGAELKKVDRDRTLTDELPASTPIWLRDKVREINSNWRADPARENKRLGKAVLRLMPYAVLLSIPFYAGLLQLVHLGSRRPYGAHFVFALHLHAFWYGCCTLLLVPWGPVALVSFLWANVYPVLALKRVYPGGWAGTLVRATVLAFLHLLLIVVGMLGVLVLGAISD